MLYKSSLGREIKILNTDYITPYGIKLPYFSEIIWKICPNLAIELSIPKDTINDGFPSFLRLNTAFKNIKKLINDHIILWGNTNGLSCINVLKEWDEFISLSENSFYSRFNIICICKSEINKNYNYKNDCFYNNSDKEWCNGLGIMEDTKRFTKLEIKNNELFQECNEKLDIYPWGLRNQKNCLVIEFDKYEFYIDNKTQYLIQVKRGGSEKTNKYRWIGFLDSTTNILKISETVWKKIDK